MLLFTLAGGWVLGLSVGLLASPPLLFSLALLPAPIAAAALVGRHQRLLLVALAIVALVTGMVRVGGVPQAADPFSVGGRLGAKVTITGTIRGDPLVRGQLVRMHLDVTTIDVGSGPEAIHGGVVGWLGRDVVTTPYRNGDQLALTGSLVAPPTFPDFDYRATLEGTGITAAMYRPDVALVARSSGALRWLSDRRENLASSLSRSLAEPEASLARALLLGQRDGISPEVRTQWNRAGTAHLLSISGLHIAVVLGLTLAASAALFGRRGGLYLLTPLFAIWAYASLAGLGPPVQRAALMGSAYLLAIAAGRQSSGGLALVMSAAIMAGIEPHLLGEASFQLSFAAMAGLVYLSPIVHGWLGRLTKIPETPLTRFVMASVAASTSATIAIMPLLSYHFGMTSVLSVPATLVAIPALPVLLAMSGLAAVAGLIGDLPGQVFGWLGWPWLRFLLTLSDLFGNLPFAAIVTGPVGAVSVVALYVVAVAVLWRPLFGRPSGLLGPMVLGPAMDASFRRGSGILGSYALLIPVAVSAAWLWTPLITSPAGHGQLEISVLNVGQGDAILIQGPSGARVLIDGGIDGMVLEREVARQLPWWSRRLDLIVLTHPNADHVTGLIDVLRRRPVAMILDPHLSSSTSVAKEWERLSQEGGADGPVNIHAVSGTIIGLGDGAYMEVLHPPERLLTGTNSDTDNNSVVLRVVYRYASFLLTADIFEPAESFLVSQGVPLSATVMKMPHHGSANSGSEAFLNAVHPTMAFVSAATGNPFGHPSVEAVARVRQHVVDDLLFRTDQDGTIRFVTDGFALQVDTDATP